ncbi:MAG: DUF2177 family protein, partial [Candidatus Bipolaricaulota bacterium]
MNVYRGFLLYLIMLGAFFAIDMTWLGVVARGFYRNQIGPLMADELAIGEQEPDAAVVGERADAA